VVVVDQEVVVVDKHHRLQDQHNHVLKVYCRGMLVKLKRRGTQRLR
jgi:hypothetical protein